MMILHLKSAVSKAIKESNAESSGIDMMWYLIIDSTRKGAACVALAYSLGKGAASQVCEVGAISRSAETVVSVGLRVVTNEGSVLVAIVNVKMLAIINLTTDTVSGYQAACHEVANPV
jgi:hypothetical protein